MVKQEIIDIFDAPIDMLAHQANCMNTMGSGIARKIREKFPEAYEADCKTIKGDAKKFGTFSFAKIVSPNNNPRLRYVVNIYSQYNFGRDKRYTDYEAVYCGFTSLRDKLLLKNNDTVDVVVGIPWRYGCNVAGGDWNVVEAIINSVFGESKINALICKHPSVEQLNKEIKSTPSQLP